MYLGQDCHRRNHRPGGQYKNLKDKQPDKGQWVGKGESEPPKRDKEEVWMGETISFAGEIRNKMVSVRRVQGRETREIAVFWLQDWVCFQSSLPFPGTRRWGWGASRLVVTWACIFLPPPVPGIPENSFRLNPKRAPFGFRTMPGNTEGRGPRLAPEGSRLLRRQLRPKLPSRPTGPRPQFSTRTPVHSLLPHPSSRPLPAHLCPSPHRAQSPPTSTPPGSPRTRPGAHLSPPGLGGCRTLGTSGGQLYLPRHPPAPGARSPGGRVLELERERLLDDAVVHLQQDHGGGCPGQGKEKQGQVRVGKGGKDGGSGPRPLRRGLGGVGG